MKTPPERAAFSFSRQNPDLMALVGDEFKYATENNPKGLSREELLDQSVRSIFQFQRHWLSYTLPKWFHVTNLLQEFACKKRGVNAGDYKFFASSLENDFLEPRLTFLIEMGVPRSAVKKIELFLSKNLEGEDAVVDFINKNRRNFGFSEYEIERIDEL